MIVEKNSLVWALGEKILDHLAAIHDFHGSVARP